MKNFIPKPAFLGNGQTAQPFRPLSAADPSRLRDDGVVVVVVDGAVDRNDLSQLVHDGLNHQDQGARCVDELALVDRDVGVDCRDQELADALRTVGI